jgi:serine/threonine-protein kinase
VAEAELHDAVIDGRYHVIEPIASGAMGSVWRAERVGLGRAVAIKIMHEALPDELASRQRFEREAKLMAKLEHPNCVSVIDYGVYEDKPYLVMELVRGTSLIDLLAREGRVAPQRAVDILKQVLSGLAHAHALGIVHRDIKPANLMVAEQAGIGFLVRILDFGLARADGQSKLTTGIVVGTPNYMAPEQCRGGQLDGRCDLYACGVILFEMVTGRKPFVADDPIAVVRMHLQAPPPRLGDVMPGDHGDLEVVVARALVKDPAQRYASAADMAHALDAALAAGKSLGHAVPHTQRTPGAQLATESGWNVPAHAATTLVASTPPALSEAARPVREPAPVADPRSSSPVPTPASRLPTEPVRRPSSARRWLVRVSTKQLAIVAGSLGVVVIVLVIIAASRRATSSSASSPPPLRDAGAAITIDNPADPVAAALADADRLVTQGDRDAALDVLARARREHPDAAPLALLAGRIYFSKLYFTDGAKALRDALRLDPALRSDPDVIKTVLRGFITTPDVDRAIESLLREDIGAPAIPYLDETAQHHPNSVIRARAAAELRRLR